MNLENKIAQYTFATLLALTPACGGGGSSTSTTGTTGSTVTISGTVSDTASVKPITLTTDSENLQAVSEWSSATLYVIDSSGNILTTATVSSNGNYSADVTPGTNYFIYVTIGNLELKAFIEDASSDLASTNVDATTTAVVMVLGETLGNSDLGELGVDVSNELSSIDVSTTITSITTDSNIATVVSEIVADIEANYDAAATTVSIGSAGTAGSSTITSIATNTGGTDTGNTDDTITDITPGDTGNTDNTTTDDPVNNPPEITSSPVTSVNENSAYSYDVDATDLDGDNLTYSLTTAPNWLSINSSTGAISGTAPDVSSDTTADVTVEVTDGTDTASQSYTITISDIGEGVIPENVSVLVKGFDSGAALSNIIFELLNTSYSCTTDSSGSCEIISVLPGNYEVQFRDNGAVYETYKPGTLQVNSTKASEGKLSGLEVRLILQADRQFVNEILRYNGEIRKWSSIPIWDIYTINVDGSSVPQSNIDEVKNAIKTEMSEFGNVTFSFFDVDINEYNIQYSPGQPVDEHVKTYWNDNMSSAGNYEWYNGSEVISGYAFTNTSMHGKAVVLQELAEILIGGGESNIYSSIFNDPSSYTSLQEKDQMLSEIIYGLYSRPAGNTSPDNNPSGTIFNE